MNHPSYLSRLGKRICQEPYRVFFPLGILIGMFGVSHWLFFSLGWQKSYSGLFHASIQIQGYMSSFIIGFLTTAMPRFTSAPTASKWELLTFLVLTLAIALCLNLGRWLVADLLFMFWLLGIVRFGAKRFLMRREKKIYPPTEFVWIPVAIFHGVVGSLLLALGYLIAMPVWILNVAKPMMLQGFLFSIVLGVGGFLGPRLMGVAQLISPESLKREEACAPFSMEAIRKRRIGIHLIAAAILFSTFWLEGLGQKLWAYLLRAVIVTAEFAFTGAFPRPPKIHHLFARLLWLSFWMIVIGSWGQVLVPQYRIAMLHIVFLGGFSLMTFAVGTVVVLSHAGEVHKLYKPLPVLWIVGIGVLGALALRISADFFPLEYFNLLGKAAILWLIGAACWFLFILLRIFRIPEEGIFEREHAAVKK